MTWITPIICSLLLCLTASAENKPAPSLPAPPSIQKPAPPPKKPAELAGPNEVPGLKLPLPLQVASDEGFVTVVAECTGTVKWLVFSTAPKVKFNISPATPNEITVAVPCSRAIVTIYCIGLIDGKQTDFVFTEITVTGKDPGPGPPDTPNPPADIKQPLHLSIVEDPTKRTDSARALLGDTELFKQLADKQVIVRVYTINDPILRELQFLPQLEKYGAPLMILSDDTGKALYTGKLPLDKASLLQILLPFMVK